MILDKFVKLKAGGKNIKYLKTLYPDIKLLQEIIIPIEKLTIGSNVKINCVCDICGTNRKISYQKYKESEKNNDEYACQKCSHKKRKITNNEKYGFDNYVETKEFNEKSIKTIKEKYGDIDNVFQSDIIKNKIKDKMIEKYGVEHISQSDNIKKKKEDDCLIKYGVKYYYQSDDFKNKSYKTKLERYDDINYTNIEKCVNTKIKNGNIIPKEYLSDWKLYKRIVWRLTNRIRKELYEKWNGIDFYDGEYIKENLNHYKYDSDYPTIDHKISVKCGFDNFILPTIIADLKNLVITKRHINSKKGTNNSLL